MSRSAPERRLERLDWTVVRRLDGLLQGDYRTVFKGQGLDLADIREYAFGDDVRHIDWNVTARLDTPLCARVPRGSRDQCAFSARSLAIRRFRHRRPQETRPTHRLHRAARAPSDAPRQPRRRHALWISCRALNSGARR